MRKHRDIHFGDRAFYWGLRAFGLLTITLLLMMAWQLFKLSGVAFHEFGWRFLWSQDWDPVQEQFGALPFIYGTLVSSLLALLIATPISVGVALYLSDVAPNRWARGVGFLVEMLAAIPSVVYGLWGIFVLAPLLREKVQPVLGETLGFLPLFEGAPYGVGMMAAGVILAIMITPTIASICREVFASVPRVQREAALGMGATRWEMMRISVLSASHTGILGAIILGLGRAMGETMAVTMVIGNRAEIAASLFAPGQTMASVIANEYAEATSDVHLSALAAVGLVLFLISFIVNGIARAIVWRVKRSGGTA